MTYPWHIFNYGLIQVLFKLDKWLQAANNNGRFLAQFLFSDKLRQ